MTARQTENGPKHYFDESRQNLLGWLIKVELWHNAANYTNIEPMICSSFVVLLRIWSSLDRGGYPGETLDEFVAAKPAGCDNVECNTLGSAKMARLEGQCGEHSGFSGRASRRVVHKNTDGQDGVAKGDTLSRASLSSMFSWSWAFLFSPSTRTTEAFIDDLLHFSNFDTFKA